MSASGDFLTASERAIDSYLEELLEEPGDPGNGAQAAMSDQYCIFDVSGLAVAVPAASVRGETDRPPLQAAPGTPPWLRRAAGGGRERMIIDLALLVLPIDLSPDHIPLEERCDSVLSLYDSDWGLALEGATQNVFINSGDVCWRGPLGIRPWLAGTIAERRGVVLDLGNIRRLGQLGVE